MSIDDIEKIRRWIKETREFLETFDMGHHREKKYTAEDFKKEKKNDRTECKYTD